MQINQVATVRGQSWIANGWDVFRQNPGLWLTMAVIYLAMALLLQEIPFIGYLVLVLITPLMGSAAIMSADETAAGTAAAPGSFASIKARFADAAARFRRAALDSERNLPVMVVATLMLGAMVVIQIFAQLLKVGGSALPAMLAGSVGPSIWLPALISLILIWGLKLTLIAITMLATCLIVLQRETPLVAIETAIKAATRNWLPLAIIAVVLLVPLGLAAYLGPPVRYLAISTIGLVTLPLFITSSYAAYKELFDR